MLATAWTDGFLPLPLRSDTGNDGDRNITLLCDDGSSNDPVARFDEKLVCVRLQNPDTGVIKKAPFYPKVDVFASVTVSGSSSDEDLLASVEELQTEVEIAGIVSPPITYFSLASVAILQDLYAIVRIAAGEVTAITWDKPDKSCAENACDVCIEGRCALRVLGNCEDGDTTCCSGASCDLRVYVTFIGTDRYNDPAKTAGLRKSLWNRFTFGAAAVALAEASSAAAAAAGDAQSGLGQAGKDDGSDGSSGGGSTGGSGSTGNGTTGGNGTTDGNVSTPTPVPSSVPSPTPVPSAGNRSRTVDPNYEQLYELAVDAEAHYRLPEGGLWKDEDDEDALEASLLDGLFGGPSWAWNSDLLDDEGKLD